MIQTAERRLRDTVERATAGIMPIEAAVRSGVACGCVAIGTAVSSEGYVPIPQVNSFAGIDVPPNERWRMLETEEHGTGRPGVRASKVGSTVVWAAYGG